MHCVSSTLFFRALNVLCHLVLSRRVRQLLLSSFILQTWKLRPVADKVTCLRGSQLINAGARIQTQTVHFQSCPPAPAATLSYFKPYTPGLLGLPELRLVSQAPSSSGARRMRSVDPAQGYYGPVVSSHCSGFTQGCSHPEVPAVTRKTSGVAVQAATANLCRSHSDLPSAGVPPVSPPLTLAPRLHLYGQSVPLSDQLTVFL